MSESDEKAKQEALLRAARALSTNTTSAANVSIGSAPDKSITISQGGLRGITVQPGLINIPLTQSGLRFTFQDELLSEMTGLRRKLEEGAKALQRASIDKKEQEKVINTLKENTQRLETLNRLGFLSKRISDDGWQHLIKHESFQKLFLEPKQCNAFVMSVDIRRSTELMLKAQSASMFAEFITQLCDELVKIVCASYGVLDKFTGDGILAFFPDFYSGEDAGYRAMSVADQCHKVFAEHYKKSRSSFISVLMDAGLGIGVDYGEVHLVQVADSLTVVGRPVVYACRLSGAPAGHTYLNQPAYQQISNKFGAKLLASEESLVVKHEGAMLAYDATLNRDSYSPIVPSWPT